MRQLLNINNLHPKKSLGQNFIRDKNFILKLGALIDNEDYTNIFEIGPGLGALTECLAKKKFKKLFLIEKDAKLSEKLKNRYIDKTNIFSINCDALKYDYECSTNDGKSLIVGNLPFNISSQLLLNWIINFSWPPFYNKMILMFQKEVAERILASHNQKKYGRISVITQSRCNVKKLLNAPSYIFSPKPKVDGTVLEFTPIRKYESIDIKNLQKIVKKSFEQRRKKIKTTLKDYINIIDELKIDSNLRAENLSVDDYCKLASAI